jgi:uncharacterized membrane protein
MPGPELPNDVDFEVRSSRKTMVLFVLAVVIGAVVAAAQIGKLRRRLDEQERRLGAMSDWLKNLQDKVASGPPASAATPQVALPIRPPPPRATPPRPVPPPLAPPPAAPGVQPPHPMRPEPPVPVQPAVSKPGLDWESLISVRGFAWLGGVALFLGAALFLHYAIQHGWITPAMRVAIGGTVGIAALIGGDRLRAKGEWAGQATSGAGVAILYASFYAAAMLYHLVPTFVAFAAMILVTIVAGVVAVTRKTFLLALLGLTGGFLTPPLLSSGEDHPIVLFAYVLLLDLGVVAVVRRRGWREIQLLALLGTCALYAAWAIRFLTPERVIPALLAAAVLAALFVFLRTAEGVRDSEFGLEQAIPALALASSFFLSLAVSARHGFSVPTGFLVPYLLLLSAGVVIVSRATGQPVLIPLAAALSMLTLCLRVGRDLFPAQRVPTLVLDALVPLAFFLLWRGRRSSPEEKTIRVAVAVALLGALLVAMAVDATEQLPAPIAPLALFAAFHAGLFVAIGGTLGSGQWILAASGYWFVCSAMLQRRFQDARFGEFLPWLVAPIVVFGAVPFLSERFRRDRAAWLTGVIAPAVFFGLLYVRAENRWGREWLGVITVFLAAVAWVCQRRAKSLARDPDELRFLSLLYGSLAVGLVTVAVPMLLEKEWITLAWAAESAALAWLCRRTSEPGVIVGCWLLAGGALVRLVANGEIWTYHDRTGIPFFNWYMYAFGATAALFLISARWVSTNETARSIRFPETLTAAAGALIFMLINIEIADFYSIEDRLVFRVTGGNLAQDMTYSLAWGIYALVLLVLGIRKHSKMTRAAALVVLVLTIAKVFLHDLWDLGALYRVGSIVGLAIALLAVSYLTQRFVLGREKA